MLERRRVSKGGEKGRSMLKGMTSGKEMNGKGKDESERLLLQCCSLARPACMRPRTTLKQRCRTRAWRASAKRSKPGWCLCTPFPFLTDSESWRAKKSASSSHEGHLITRVGQGELSSSEDQKGWYDRPTAPSPSTLLHHSRPFIRIPSHEEALPLRQIGQRRHLFDYCEAVLSVERHSMWRRRGDEQYPAFVRGHVV